MTSKKTPSLLIVDPDRTFAQMIIDKLTKDGWVVRHVKTIKEAERALLRKASDLLLVDPAQEEGEEAHVHKRVNKLATHTQGMMVLTKEFSRAMVAALQTPEARVLIKKGDQTVHRLTKRLKTLLESTSYGSTKNNTR